MFSNRHLLFSFAILFYLISFSCTIKAQGNYIEHINSKSKSILDDLKTKFGMTFNYLDKDLPDTTFTFSIDADDHDLLEKVFTIIDRDFERLDKNVYIVRASKMPVEKKIEPKKHSGQVVSEDGDPLPFCNIDIPKLNLFFETNQNGQFQFDQQLSKDTEIELSYIGYKDKSIPISKLEQHNPIIMIQDDHILGEVIIQTYRKTFSTDQLINTYEINKDKFEVPGIGYKDVFQLAQSLPGIQTSSETLADLQIRGGPPDQIAYNWNGINLFQNSLFYGRVSSVNPFMVDEIKISKNGASASQTTQASGAIELQTKQNIDNQFNTYLFLDLLHFNIGANLPIIKNKLSAKIAYRNSLTQLIKSPYQRNIFDQLFVINRIRDDEYFTQNFDPFNESEFSENFTFNDLSTFINYKPNDKLEFNFSLSSFGNDFQYGFDRKFWEPNLITDTLSLNSVGLSTEVNYKIKNNSSIKLKGQLSQYSNRYTHNNNTRASINPEFRTVQNQIKNNWSSLTYAIENKHLDLEFGIQAENWNVSFIDTTLMSSSALFYINKENMSYELSSFLQATLKPIDHTLIQFGLRYSDYSLALDNRKFIEPRVHVSYLGIDDLKIHFHYGKFHQNLNRRDHFLPLDVERGLWFLSDERPYVEDFIWSVQNTQSSIGLVYSKHNWELSVDAYNKQIDRLWSSALNFTVDEDPFSFGQLDAWGIESSFKYQNSYATTLVNYLLSNETLSTFQDNILQANLPSPFTQRHRFSIYQIFNFKEFSTSFRYHTTSGRFYSEGQELSKDEENNRYIISYPNGILNAQSPRYASLDLSFFYNLKIEKFNRFKLGLHFLNVMNRNNIIINQTHINYTQNPFTISQTDRPGIPFSWNISVETKF